MRGSVGVPLFAAALGGMLALGPGPASSAALPHPAGWTGGGATLVQYYRQEDPGWERHEYREHRRMEDQARIDEAARREAWRIEREREQQRAEWRSRREEQWRREQWQRQQPYAPPQRGAVVIQPGW